MNNITKLVAYNGSLLLAHWRANTVTNEHKALGDLYESMSELTDDLAEVCMGKHGLIEITEECIGKLDNPPADGLEIVEQLMKEYKGEEDLTNILADMQIALNKAAYLLKSGTAEKETSVEEFSDEGMPA